MIEIRHRVVMSEYLTIWGTFVAIQIVGVDFGILIGVLVAIVDNVVSTAKTTTVHRVSKRSRAIWTPSEDNILQQHGYHPSHPKIVTLNISGPVFFASSLGLLDGMYSELGLQQNGAPEQPLRESRHVRTPSTPHTSSHLLMTTRQPSMMRDPHRPLTLQRPPEFCVLDFSQITTMDASAARTCFLQLSTICSKQGIIVCAAGATPHMDWILRSHSVSYSADEEERIKAQVQTAHPKERRHHKHICEKVLLFTTLHEALEFCETVVVHQFSGNDVGFPSERPLVTGPEELTLSAVFARILDSPPKEVEVLERLDGQRYHEEITFNAGEKVFSKGSQPSSFYVVMKGVVVSGSSSSNVRYRHRQKIITGAGIIKVGSGSSLFDLNGKNQSPSEVVVATVWPVCTVFGYSDMLLERPRVFGAIAKEDGTKVARITRSDMNLMIEDAPLNALLHRVLLRASVLDLQNCICDDV